MAGALVLPALSAAPRLPNARQRFDALLASRWAAPFQWGLHDCCLWAADAVQAQLGVDPAARLRGGYGSAIGAGRLVRLLGGLEHLATQALGRPLAGPLLACVGDVGLTHSGALVVCLGEHWAAAGRRGLVLVPLANAAKAWRVGCA